MTSTNTTKTDILKKYSNEILFETAKQWLNTSFRWHGYTKYGCDCSGFIVGVLKEIDVIDDEFLLDFKQLYYGNNLSKIDSNFLHTQITKYFKILDKNSNQELKKTDLILLKTKNSPIHFAFYSQNEKKIIHSTRENGVVMIDFDIEKNTEIIDCFELKKLN